MAFKMKGFNYPGKAPVKSSPAKSWLGALSNVFKDKDDKSQSGSLLQRMLNFQEKKENTMKQKEEDISRDPQVAQVEQEVKKNAYSMEGELVSDTEETQPKEESKKQL